MGLSLLASDVQLPLLNILLYFHGINELTLRAPWCHSTETMSNYGDKRSAMLVS